VIIRFVDFGGIADHHYLNFLFIMEHGKAQFYCSDNIIFI
jgi:hypothetical protein